jgi:hypothetical protein
MAYFCNCEVNPMFQPAVRLIMAMSDVSQPLVPATLVTTTFSHGYKTGLIVRLVLPEVRGMPEVNDQTYQITVVSNTEFTIPVDSSEFDPFITPDPSDYDRTAIPGPTLIPGFVDVCAWVVPIGEGTDYTDSTPLNVRV